MSEAGAAVRAFDQARQIGEHEAAAVLVLDDPEVGLKRRERVVGDLRPRPGEAGDQRALAGVGKADQADVGQQPELQAHPLLLALGARLREARCLQGGRGEVHVAEAASAAFRQHPPAAVLAQVGDHLGGLRIADQRSRGHLQHHLRRCMAVLIATAAGLAVPCPVLALEAEVEQRGEPLIGLEDDVAAVAAVAARGTPARDELLAAEGHRAGAPVAGLHQNLRFVDELHGVPAACAGPPRRGPYAWACALAGSTCT